jgi:VWFA-related protein
MPPLRFLAGSFALAAVLLTPAPARQINHDVKVINIEVPVRVYKGSGFVDNLQRDDFELLENGVPQDLDAVYLVRKTNVARNEGGGAALPRTARLFVLLFEMTDYQPEVARAMDFFFDRVIEPQDELILLTPMKTYAMKTGMITKTSRAKAKSDLLAKVRSDVMIGSSEYLGLIRELTKIMTGDNDLDDKLQKYGETLSRLESLRYVDEKKLIEFARLLKSREGQKHVFFFYQKEVIPKINAREIQRLMMENQDRPDIQLGLMEKFEFFKRDVKFDVAAVQKAFSDSSIAVHFLYITRTRMAMADVTQGRNAALSLEEQSEDIFSAFSEIARATGGLIDSSASAERSFQRAVEASENFYLLYYRPKDYKPDGTFREIVVRVKGAGVRVSHRLGYFAS